MIASVVRKNGIIVIIMNNRSKNRHLIIFFGIFCGLLVISSSISLYFIFNPPSRHSSKKRFFWDNSWNPNQTIDIIQQYPEVIDLLSPVWYSLQENGSVHYARTYPLDEILATCKTFNIQVQPLISNYHEESFNGELISSVINNETKTANFINSLNQLLSQYHFSGFHIDFEAVPATDRAIFSSFLQAIRNALDSNYLLSIAVPPKTVETTEGWSGGFDYQEIGEICNYVMVMTYDAHGGWSEPGEIAPTSWVKKVLNYAKQVIPKEKIFIGIPRYGYDWSTNEDWVNYGFTYHYFEEKIGLYGGTPIRTSDGQELRYEYVDNQGFNHICYFCDSETSLAKEEALSNDIFEGFCYWHLSSGDPDLFNKITK